jgi:Fe-S cluster biogenesis protein NfuA
MRRRIQKVIDDMINPAVDSHGGRVDLVDFVNADVYLRLSGGCQGCSSSSATLRNGIERLLREEFPEIRNIIDVTDHAAGENPYYRDGDGSSPVG